MMTTTIHLLVEALVLIVLGLLLYRFIKNTNDRLKAIEKSVGNLSMRSKNFPDFIQQGEKVFKDISEELTMKQNVLKKLIVEAEKASDRLDLVEQKIKEKKLDKQTIDKVLILVNQGFTAAEIAPKLNIPIGETELVIKLRKYLNAPIKERL